MDRQGVALTQKAAEQLRGVMAEQGLEPQNEWLRVGVRGEGPARSYALDLTDISYDDDKKFESNGIRIVCSGHDMPVLNGAIIDYREVTGGVSGFTFDVPDEKHISHGSGDHEKPAPDVESVRKSLYQVYDPEVGVNIVDLGLVYGLEVRGRDVVIRMTLTTPACPLGEQIRGDAHQSIRHECPGVDSIEITTVWDPPWSNEKMSAEGKRQLGWSS